jgi:hypothetical protein
MLRAWRAPRTSRAASSLRSWLYTIATNVCLRAIERRPKRVLPVDYGPPTADPHADAAAPLGESVWVEPYPTTRSSSRTARRPARPLRAARGVELAFIAALQHLPAQQRAVLILRDVLGFPAPRSPRRSTRTPTRSTARSSARTRLSEERLPAQTQQATLRALGDAGLRDTVAGYGRRVGAPRCRCPSRPGSRRTPPLSMRRPSRVWFRGPRRDRDVPARAAVSTTSTAGASSRRRRTASPRSASTSGTSRRRRSCPRNWWC